MRKYSGEIWVYNLTFGISNSFDIDEKEMNLIFTKPQNF